MALRISSLLWLFCAVFAIGNLGTSDEAHAQLSCPATSGDDGDSGQVRWIRVTSGSCEAGLTSLSDYNDPTTTSNSFSFTLFLPGDAPAVGDTNSVKFLGRDASGTALDISEISCTIYTRSFLTSSSLSGIGTTVGSVTLEDGDICDLKILFDNGNGDISYVGRTLSRVGNTYSIGEGRLVGGDFGNTFSTESGSAATLERDGVAFATRTQSDPFLVIHSDTDDVPTQTIGQPFTLSYTITNIGTERVDIGQATFDFNPHNLDNCSISYRDPRAPSPESFQMLLWVGHSVNLDFTCTPLHASDFSTQFYFNLNDLPLTLTVRGPGDDPADTTKERTENIIKNFMVRRGDQIVSKEPDLTKRLGRRAPPRRSLKDAPPLKLGGPINVSGQGTERNNRLAFSTSLSQVVGSMVAAKQQRVGDTAAAMKSLAAGTKSEAGNALKSSTAMGLGYGGNGQPQTGFGLWAEGTWARIDDGTTGSDFGLLYAGADYRFNDGFVVGLLAQFDHTDERDAVNDFSIKGKGWLVGPYVVARLSSNLIFDARAAWGKSDNEVSPYNTYTDEFKGRRSLVRSRLTGDFQFGRLHVAPHVGVVYYKERQRTYIDSQGNTIGAQKVELGRLTFGPKLSTTFTRPDGATITPHVAVHGIWDFRRTDIVNIDTGIAVSGTDDFRARTEIGITARRIDGMMITAEGFYDGIGANGFDAFGGTLRFDVPF